MPYSFFNFRGIDIYIIKISTNIFTKSIDNLQKYLYILFIIFLHIIFELKPKRKRT